MYFYPSCLAWVAVKACLCSPISLPAYLPSQIWTQFEANQFFVPSTHNVSIIRSWNVLKTFINNSFVSVPNDILLLLTFKLLSDWRGKQSLCYSFPLSSLWWNSPVNYHQFQTHQQWTEMKCGDLGMVHGAMKNYKVKEKNATRNVFNYDEYNIYHNNEDYHFSIIILTWGELLHQEYPGRSLCQSVQLCGGRGPGSLACWWHQWPGPELSLSDCSNLPGGK